ncbi:MAG TPA: RluA family pseudouridine synthase [Candidatus Azosocius sp. HAIN]
MKKKFFTKIKSIKISEKYVSQRIDNFLFSYYKILSKKYIQKIIRKGEVRINKKRIKNFYNLNFKDIIRIPPIYITKKNQFYNNSFFFFKKILNNILYENKVFLIINKPIKISVHNGINTKNNIIFTIKNIKCNKYIELVHRLDKNTSGCLILSKSFKILKKLNTMIKKNKIKKIYHLLCNGFLTKKKYIYIKIKNNLNNNLKILYNSLNKFNYIKIYKTFSLLEVIPYTGKKHQIRINIKKIGNTIIGDYRYLNNKYNYINKIFYNRLFLHSKKIKLICPILNKILIINAPYDNLFYKIINKIY